VLRYLTAGESHGPALVAVLDGLPAGVQVTTRDLANDLARRRLGYGRGARMSFEADEVDLTGGVRHGQTLGGPIAVRVGNTEWPNGRPSWPPIRSTRPFSPSKRAARR
jgi:chorismate synthase